LPLLRDQAFRIVCNIRTPAANGGYIVGTGVFMTTNGSDAYLITASHVAKSTNSSTLIAVQSDDGRCQTFWLASLTPSLAWRYHDVADMALLPLGGTVQAQLVVNKRCLEIDCFNLQKKAASRDDELTAIGFPNGLGVDGMFSPLTFRSFASSGYLTLDRADTHTPQVFFCLENPSVGGYSGCPVIDLAYMVSGFITQSKGNPVCHGIMHGTMSDNTGGKLALVTPMFYLNDLLE